MRTMLRQLDELQRRYRAEEICLASAVEQAQSDHDHWLRQVWIQRDGPDAPPAIAALCEQARQELETLERRLAHLRTALAGIRDEIALLRAPVAPAWQSRALAGA